jgi:hypothetical protein
MKRRRILGGEEIFIPSRAKGASPSFLPIS